MSFILPSATALTPPGKPTDTTAARHNAQEPEAPDSFGEVLSRALTPTGEPAGRPGAKPVTPGLTRRHAADDKTDPQELLNATALALVPPPEGKVMPSALTRAELAVADNTSAARIAAAPLTEPGAGVAADTATVALAPDLAPASPGAQAQAALMAASHTGQTLPQARFNTASGDTTLALVPGPSRAQAHAPGAATSDPSSQADDEAPHPPVITLSAAKVAPVATAAAPADEAAAMTVSASQTPVADSFSPNAALPLSPVNAVALGSAGVAASNAPPSAATSSLLAPEVGSGEWGKALGQQVVQMGHAGHQVAELQLNPPGLGPLKVTLSLNDHQIQAMFVSAHASVRAAVEASLPQLRATLADNGISLGNTSVSADSQQQAAFTQEQNRQPNHRAYPNSPLSSTPASLSPRPLSEPLRHHNGITVDTYA